MTVFKPSIKEQLNMLLSLPTSFKVTSVKWLTPSRKAINLEWQFLQDRDGLIGIMHSEAVWDVASAKAGNLSMNPELILTQEAGERCGTY